MREQTAKLIIGLIRSGLQNDRLREMLLSLIEKRMTRKKKKEYFLGIFHVREKEKKHFLGIFPVRKKKGKRILGIFPVKKKKKKRFSGIFSL